MSFQIIPQAESPLVSTLKGVGQGFSEQLPKEVERHRLSQGLSQISPELGKLAGIPGMTPELMSYALQQIQKQNFLNREPGGQAPIPGGSAKPNASGQTSPKENAQTNKVNREELLPSGFAPASEISRFKKGLQQEPTAQQINDRAKDILRQGITQDPSQANTIANQEIKQDLQAQRDRLKAFETEANNRIARSLQGSGLGDYKDIPGELQNSLVDQGKYAVENLGQSPEEAADNIEKITTDLGKTINKLKGTGSSGNMFKHSSTKAKDLRAQKKDFEKYGFGEQFDDLVTKEMGFTPLLTAHILDPVKNITLKSEIEKLPSKLGNRTSLKPGTSGSKIDEKTLDKIARHVTPQDNLFAVEYLIREKGYDVNQFEKKVEDLDTDNFIDLSKQQKRQIQRPKDNAIWGDILFQAF